MEWYYWLAIYLAFVFMTFIFGVVSTDDKKGIVYLGSIILLTILLSPVALPIVVLGTIAKKLGKENSEATNE